MNIYYDFTIPALERHDTILSYIRPGLPAGLLTFEFHEKN
jgi:hypothetical protein